MQTLIQVFCKGSSTSLRSKINNDKKLIDFNFKVINFKTNKRKNGWSKISNTKAAGTINLEWDANIKMLSVRIVNRGDGRPDKIIGLFIHYLFSMHNKEIKTIQIIPIE